MNASITKNIIAYTVVTLGISGSVPVLGHESDTTKIENKKSEVHFDRAFLVASPYSLANIDQFEKDSTLTPGNFYTEIFVNGQYRSSILVKFIKNQDENVSLCLNEELLSTLGLDEAEEEKAQQKLNSDCGDFNTILPNVEYSFDQSKLNLRFTIPQAMLKVIPKGAIDPNLWHFGEIAAAVNYNASTFHSKSKRQSTNDSYYLGLSSRFHLNNWLVKHNGSLTKSSNDDTWSFVTDTLHLQTDLPSMCSSLKAGKFYSDGQYFDSLKFAGIELYSDDRMLPDGMQGFAPIIRGIAKSNSKVTIKQNGNVVYETSVPEGPFSIRDLQASGSGDYEVILDGANGEVETFIVPFSFVPELVRPGTMKYSTTSGQVYLPKNFKNQDSGNFLQANVITGLTNSITLIAGGQLYKDYSRVLAGTAVNTSMGAVGVNFYASRAKVNNSINDTIDGNQLRTSYSKLISSSETYINATYSRYSQEGVHTLNDFIYSTAKIDGNESGHYVGITNGLKDSLSLSINQTLPSLWGSLGASYYSNNHWSTNESNDKNWALSYSNNFNQISYGISATQTKNSKGQNNDSLSLTISVPLSNATNQSMGTLSANYFNSHNSSESGSIGYSNNAFNSDLNYGATLGKSANNNSLSSYASYNTGAGILSTNVSKSENFTQGSFGASGSLVAFSQGILLGPQVSDTFAIIHAPGAEGAQVLTSGRGRLNNQGNAVVPYIRPYKNNNILISPKDTDLNIQFAQTQKQVIPRANTVSIVNYQTAVTKPMVIKITNAKEDRIAFGANVIDEQGTAVGFMVNGGSVFIENAQSEQTLRIQTDSRICEFTYFYDRAVKKENQSYAVYSTDCKFIN